MDRLPFKKIFLLLLAFWLLPILSPAQKQLKPISYREGGLYTRMDAGFSVEMPFGTGSGISMEEFGEPPHPSLGKGSFIRSGIDGIRLDITFYKILTPLNETGSNAQLIGDFKKVLLEGIKPENISNLDLQYLPGKDSTGNAFKINLNNSTIFYGIYIFDRRLYTLMAVFNSKEHEKTAAAFMNSFRFRSKEEIIKLRLSLAEAAAFPKNEPGKKTVNEIRSKSLKGRVKYLKEESEAIEGKPISGTRTTLSESWFDNEGGILKAIKYNAAGEREGISVFGYLNEKRVEKYVLIPKDTDQFGPRPAAPFKVKPGDSRYTYRHEAAYDSKKRIIEELAYENDGDLISKKQFIYSDRKIEIWHYGKAGSLLSKIDVLLDKKGFEIQRKIVPQTVAETEATFVYKYEKVDKAKNWTQRRVYKVSKENGKETETLNFIEYRTIKY